MTKKKVEKPKIKVKEAPLTCFYDRNVWWHSFPHWPFREGEVCKCKKCIIKEGLVTKCK